MSPTTPEREAAGRAMADLFACIQCAAPSVEIDVIGSQGTGLASPFSDIDLNVAPTYQHSDRDAFTLLGYLAKEMQKPQANPYRPKRNPVQVNVFIDHARIPIISGVHVPTGLDFQIQSATDCFRTMEYTRSFLSEYPTLQALFLVLKQMLKMRGLTDGWKGGLTTYPLIGMIVAALKFSEGKFDRQDVGQQLLFFLDMYGDIDFYTTGISISPLQYTRKRMARLSSVPLPRNSPIAPDRTGSSPPLSDLRKEDLAATKWISVLNTTRPFLMSLQDPANMYNDLGRGVFMIKHIQATLITARERLKETMKAWEECIEEKRVEPNSPKPILAWLLGGDYRLFEHERQELRKGSLQGSRSIESD